MSDMNITAGVCGVQGALETQRLASDLITRTLSDAQLNQPEGSVSAKSQNTVLAKAVTGLGSKIDINV